MLWKQGDHENSRSQGGTNLSSLSLPLHAQYKHKLENPHSLAGCVEFFWYTWKWRVGYVGELLTSCLRERVWITETRWTQRTFSHPGWFGVHPRRWLVESLTSDSDSLAYVKKRNSVWIGETCWNWFYWFVEICLELLTACRKASEWHENCNNW